MYLIILLLLSYLVDERFNGDEIAVINNNKLFMIMIIQKQCMCFAICNAHASKISNQMILIIDFQASYSMYIVYACVSM